MGYSYAIVGAIRRMTKVPMILNGKPSLHALRFVARKLGIPVRNVGVVGDDPAVEVIMARRGGATAFGVTTGVLKQEDWDRETGNRRPHYVLNDLRELPGLRDTIVAQELPGIGNRDLADGVDHVLDSE
jgi:4-nitrophenyl phosphatase